MQNVQNGNNVQLLHMLKIAQHGIFNYDKTPLINYFIIVG